MKNLKKKVFKKERKKTKTTTGAYKVGKQKRIFKKITWTEKKTKTYGVS